jgi:hypothetical protein
LDEVAAGFKASRNARHPCPGWVKLGPTKFFRQHMSDQRTRSEFAELGLTVLLGSPPEFRKIIADDIEKWAKVVKFSGVKPD